MTKAEKVYEVTKSIPSGKVATYSDVAICAGVGSPRFVGNVLHTNPDQKNIPCHRVVNAKGELAKNFAFGGLEEKKRLEEEGVEIKNGRLDLNKYRQKKEVAIVKNGGVIVYPTDTLYGILGEALNKKTVERIYEIKGRNLNKPFIVLVSSINDLGFFEVTTDNETREYLNKIWPGQVSVIFQVKNKDLEYLTRGTGSLAFRLPQNEELKELIKETGPLVAPSANPEGKAPATTVGEAKNYFSSQVDYYVDGGFLQGQPSTVISYKDGKVEIVRKGAGKILLK